MNFFNLFKKPMYLVHYKYITECETIDGYGSWVIKGNFTLKKIDEIYKDTTDFLINKYGNDFKFNIVIVNICKIR